MLTIFAKVRRLSVVSVQAINCMGSIEYFIFVHTEAYSASPNMEAYSASPNMASLVSKEDQAR